MLKFLELKIPPPIVTIIFLLIAWWLQREFPLPITSGQGGVATLVGMAAGILVGMAIFFIWTAVKLFNKSETTINPRDPKEASKLVITGIFGASRNPMYVGLLFFFLGIQLWVNSWWALLVVLLMAYLQEFQIKPEEKILSKKFGKKYNDYCKKVRRWL